MKNRVLVCFLMIAAIVSTVFLVGANTYNGVVVKLTKAAYLESKYGYNPIEIKKEKKGNLESSEDGLYWDRDSIQIVLYPDVQEVCEKAFGDYLSPLQGLTCIMTDGTGTRYRTDKQTAAIGPGYARFYLFIEDDIAVVTIEDKGNSYNTTFQILRKEDTKGIVVLKVPPTAGIGIAGTEHKPSSPNYDIHSTVTKNDELEYSKADLQLVFSSSIQEVTQKTVGNYVQALQGLYMLAEQEGYGSISRFCVEDVPMYDETTVMKENYCEFTMLVYAQDRIRVTIAKDGNQYITTFRLLKKGEFPIEEHGG